MKTIKEIIQLHKEGTYNTPNGQQLFEMDMKEIEDTLNELEEKVEDILCAYIAKIAT